MRDGAVRLATRFVVTQKSLRVLGLLAALVGGLGASSVHQVAHGLKAVAERAEHLAADPSHQGGGLSVPCAKGPAHDELCGVCHGVSALALPESGQVRPVRRVGVLPEAPVGWASQKDTGLSARGPPPTVA